MLAAPAHLPLHAWHVAHGARMESFAGWAMPIHYPLGILGEHRHTRAAAGLFDVSHMGQIMVRALAGDHLAAARELEKLVPVDVMGLKPGRQRYAVLTNGSGGVRDDLMIANLGDFWYLVVNAAAAAADLAHLQEHLHATCSVELASARALLAVQGPEACAALSALVPAVAAMRFMDAGVFAIDGTTCFISRSGYTGEDGFEMSVPVAVAEDIAERLLSHGSVRLIGLGARDSLRLEAGLCLCGHDLGEDVTPIEAALDWAIQPARRRGGTRAGGFPGADVILTQLERGVARKRVGLRPEGRPVREGAALFADPTSNAAIGRVTSGTYGPSAEGPVAMGYVPISLTPTGTRLFADVKGQRIPLAVCNMPFVPHRYHR
ncbi:MAG: aminomethyltransferase [Gammaproteobacteria bacterium]|jgi:aminomethyltransferase|nr:aminomethyltransferase [Gammaproteobacteria bacterium]